MQSENQNPIIESTAPHAPKKSIAKKVFFVIVSLFLLSVLFSGYGLIMFTELAGYPFRKLTEVKYRSPDIAVEVVVPHHMTNPVFSSHHPLVVFTKSFTTTHTEDYGGASTILFNLETEEATVLAPRNGIPGNTSMFSPHGNYLIYVVSRKDSEEVSANENGSWRYLRKFDVYVKNLDNDTDTLISTELYPLQVTDSQVKAPRFGWIDSNRMFYTCVDSTQMIPDSYCVKNIVTGNFSVAPRETIEVEYSVVAGNPPTITATPHPEVSDVIKSASHKDDPNVIAEYAYNGEIYTKVFDDSLRDVTFISQCKFNIFDGCGVPIISVLTDDGESFLYNKKDTPYQLHWGYKDTLYGLLYSENATRVYRLYP